MPSSIPGAVSNLYALLNTAFTGNEDTLVWMGASLPKTVTPVTVLILGWTGDQEPAELGPSYRREETFQIHMQIRAASGEQSPTALLDRQTTVMARFGVASALIANNWTLPSTAGGNDGTVRYAEVGTFDFTPEMNQRGSRGTLTFTVHCSQRIQSLV
jgi:hypothetical protein